MRARDYIENNYLPWILFLDTKNVINHFNNSKENYLYELYNHVTNEFKDIEHYELYMFRMTTDKISIATMNYEIIICKLPNPVYQGDSSYIFIVYNSDEVYYYTLSLVIDNNYEIKRKTKESIETIGTCSNDLDYALSSIKKSLFSI